MFGGIVDISGGLDTAHTLSVWCWGFAAPKWLYHSVLIMPARPARARTHFTRFYTFFEENCDKAPTTICNGGPGPKHIPFVAPNWGTNGHKWGLCYSPVHAPSQV